MRCHGARNRSPPRHHTRRLLLDRWRLRYPPVVRRPLREPSACRSEAVRLSQRVAHEFARLGGNRDSDSSVAVDHAPSRLSSFSAASLARVRAAGDRTGGSAIGSAPTVSAVTNRVTASREVNHRDPTRTASNLTTPPSGNFKPFLTHRKIVEGPTEPVPRWAGNNRPVAERLSPPLDSISASSRAIMSSGISRFTRATVRLLVGGCDLVVSTDTCPPPRTRPTSLRQTPRAFWPSLAYDRMMRKRHEIKGICYDPAPFTRRSATGMARRFERLA